MTNRNSSIAVLGAGISGLTLAYALSRKGAKVTVYEKRDSAGGVIRSHQYNGWLTEAGPNTLMVRSDSVWDLLEELGLGPQILEADQAAKKRFIVKDSVLQPLPMSLFDFFSTGLLSTSAKFRLFKEPFVDATEKRDESIADFIKRRLGREVLDYAVNPFVAGIFAGDPQKLSVKHTFSLLFELEKHYGSIFKGMLKRKKTTGSGKKALISFRYGLQSLPEALQNSTGVSVRYNHRVTGIKQARDKWMLEFDHGDTSYHEKIISTLPAGLLPTVMQEVSSRFQELKNIPYAPMSVIHLGYKKGHIHHRLDGFGMLVPEVEDFDILGTLFSSTLFPERAPEDHVLLTSFVGGTRNPELAHKSTDSLIAIVQRNLDRLLGISGSPSFSKHTYWKSAIPQYEVGYDRQLQMMRDIEDEFPGLFLAGNMRGGISVPDCIENSLRKAEEIYSKG